MLRVLASLFLLANAAAGARLLVVNSYHQGYEWTDAQVAGILAALKASNQEHEVYVEYLDLRRMGADNWNSIAEGYASKYAGKRIDVLIATDDYAIEFVLNRPLLFPGVPLVVSGANEYKGSSARLRNHLGRHVTGVLETVDVLETVRTGLAAHPGTQNVVTIGEADDAEYADDIARENPQLKVWRIRTQRLTADQIQRSLRELPSNTIVVLSAFSRDVTDRQFSIEQSTSLVARSSSAPVYGLNRHTLGLGTVGGKLVDGVAHGRRAGAIAAQILAGTPPTKIPLEAGPNGFGFDDAQLRRWSIDRSRLPTGSEFINEQPSFLRDHWLLLLIVSACLALQAAIIAGLIASRKRQKRARAELVVSEMRFRQLADSVPQLVWIADASGALLYCNATWHEYTGLSLVEMENSGWQIIVHPDDREATTTAWQQAVDSLQSGGSFEAEQRLRRKDGTYRWHLTHATYLQSDGRPAWLGTSTDIDYQKQTEAALRSANRDLEQFAYSASHDLQEPLRMVAVYCQLLERRRAHALDEDARTYLQYVLQGAARMNQLLQDLLSYTRTALSDTTCAAACDAQQVLDTVISDLRARMDEAGANVEAASPLPPVQAADVHVYQLLQNLIANALKYRGARAPHVQIAAVAAGSQWRFSVRDNGIGIAPAYHERIFGLFRRLHNQSEYPGTGLGLALCRKIVSRYGGDIWVESEVDRGATFFFTLPAVAEVIPVAAEAPLLVRRSASGVSSPPE